MADVRQLSKQLNELQAKAGDAARRQELLADYEKIADRSGSSSTPKRPATTRWMPPCWCCRS